jgi:hypothetical protein
MFCLAALAGTLHVYDTVALTHTLRTLSARLPQLSPARAFGTSAAAAAAAALGVGDVGAAQTAGPTIFHRYEGSTGNQLFQWAAVQGLAERANMTTCMQGGAIAALFDGGVEDGCRWVQPWGAREVSEPASRQWFDFALTRHNTVLLGNLQSYKYFGADVRSHIRFQGIARSHAQVLLQAFDEPVLVGVHVQRHEDESGTAAHPSGGAVYLDNAMAFFMRKFRHVGFVVVCDDAAWCARQHVLRRPNVHVVARLAQQPSVAMATLAACDHAIITAGTLGWWAAYLGPDARLGGMVVYFAGEGDAVESPQEFFPPHWISVHGTKGVYHPALGPQPDAAAAVAAAAAQAVARSRSRSSSSSSRSTTGTTATSLRLGEATIVTAYYQALVGDDAYARNMLSLQDAMVVFTSEDLAPEVARLRAHALNHTSIIVLSLQESKVVRDYSTGFWVGQATLDPDRDVRKDPRVYVLANEKPAFVHAAMDRNPFASSYFLWMDVELLKKRTFNGRRLVTDTLPFATNQVLLLDTTQHTANPLIDAFFVNEARVSSTMFGGSAVAMARFYTEYYKTLALSREGFVGKAATLMWRTCQRERTLCHTVENDAWFNSDSHAYFLVVYLLRRLW